MTNINTASNLSASLKADDAQHWYEERAYRFAKRPVSLGKVARPAHNA